MVEEQIKVARRGVATARGTQRMKFNHEMAVAANGLFLAHLDNVEIKKIDISESSTGMPSFNGLTIPTLNLHFVSNPDNAHFVTLRFTAVESNVDTIPGGKSDWTVNRIFDYMKHILNVYVLKGRELTDEEAAALSLPFEDFDENGQYVPVEAEKVIAGYETLFENFVNMLNTAKDGKPAYLDKDGKHIPLWIKLIRYAKKKNSWTPIANGDLSFPTFVGEGCIEIFKQNTKPLIRLDSIKERITPMKENEAKAPNMPGVVSGTPVVDPMLGNLAAEAADDAPF